MRWVCGLCVECQKGDGKDAGRDRDDIGLEAGDRHPKVWEKVVRRLAARQMPPARPTRPTEGEYDAVVSLIAGSLDRAYTYSVEGNVTDVDRQVISNRASTTVHPAKFYLGLRGHDGLPVAGKPATLDLTAVDWQGKALSGASVNVPVGRRTVDAVRPQQWARP